MYLNLKFVRIFDSASSLVKIIFGFFLLHADEAKTQNSSVRKSHKRKLKEKNDYHRNDEQVAICLECQRSLLFSLYILCPMFLVSSEFLKCFIFCRLPENKRSIQVRLVFVLKLLF